ncbi:MAG: tRNA (5-methylaminomethyl-2-thiouridine)(34)-methyltransferase MnmD [Saprospiraceae bacterium]
MTELIVTQDGSHSVFSEQFGVTYHSRFGAVTESAHVFINAGLRYMAAVQRDIAILEVGLGTALNAFMTWLEAERRNLSVRYTALEAYPVGLEEAEQFNYAGQLKAPERQKDFMALHQCAWGVPMAFSEQFVFEKKLQTLETFSAEAAYDVVYFDAFAPQAQPELWTEAVFAAMYKALRPEGILVTYCAQGHFKRTLKKAGFSVERLQGPPGKREMTRATR